MSDVERTFGILLREARLRAEFHTITAFADYLSTRGLPYSDAAIGHWENDRRLPASREVCLQVLEALAAQAGFTVLDQINDMLQMMHERDVSEAEIALHFPTLETQSSTSTALFNLPAMPFLHLVGREEIVAHLIAQLQDGDAKPVIVISGLGGIGKTAIAYEVARQLMQDEHFAGVVWQSAKSEMFTGTVIRHRQAQQMNLQSILVEIAKQLGFEGMEQLPPAELKRQLRARLQAGNYLIVLDNLETVEAAHDVAQELYELISPPVGSQPSRLLITSRERLVEEPFVYDYFVRGLSEPASLELLQLEASSRGADHLLETDDALGSRIVDVTGGMPLALILMVTQSLLGVALDEELDRLEQALDEEQIYRFIYFSIWGKLSIDAQKVLVGAATFGTSARRSHLMRVSQTEESEFIRACTELVRGSLLEVIPHVQMDRQRYDIHAMTRWFVNAPLTELWNQQRGDH